MLHWLTTIPLPTAAATALLFLAYGVGGFALEAVRWRGREPLVRLALGLGILATAAFMLGAMGLFRPGALVLLALGAAALVGSRAVARFRRRRPQEPPHERSLAGNLDVVVGAVLFLFGFAYASLPPYFYDALVYHLALPERYLLSASIAPPPNLALAGYPQNAEMLHAIAIALGGERAAALFNYFVAWGLAFGLWRFLRARTSRVAASVGVLFVVACWPFWFEATCLKNDLLGALFLLGSFAVLVGQEGGVLGRAGLAGCLAGFAVGTKYPNVLAVAALLVVVPFLVERGGRRKAVLGFALAAALAGAPWLARNAVAFGNPVYPMFGQSLGSPRLTPRGAQVMSTETGQAMDRTPLGIARRLAILGVDEAAFGWASNVSPILLPTMLLGIFATRRKDLRFGLGLGAAVIILGVSLLTAYVRTFAFAWCLGALAPAALLERARTRTQRALTLALFALGIVAAIVSVPLRLEQYSARGSRVMLGDETPEAYAARQVNYLPLALGAMRTLPDTAVVMVVGSTRAAYLTRVAEWSYVWDEPPVKTLFAAGSTPDQAVAALRQRGITHLLVNGPEMARNERLYDWLGLKEPTMREWFAELIARLSLVAKANDCYLYALPLATRASNDQSRLMRF